MEKDVSVNSLSYCGLYCGNCSGYKRGMPLMGKCAGCRAGGGPPECAIRECCKAKGHHTCAACDTFDECSLFDGFIHKVARVIFGSDKRGNLRKIGEIGVDAFIEDRIQCGRP